jgi:hypothetical protein
MVPPIARQPGWVQAVAACKNHGLALLVNGTVVQWGNRTAAGRVPDAALSNVVSMSCNDDSSFAYKVQRLCKRSCQLKRFCPSSAVCWWYVDRMIWTRPILVYGLQADGTAIGWGDKVTTAQYPGFQVTFNEMPGIQEVGVSKGGMHHLW